MRGDLRGLVFALTTESGTWHVARRRRSAARNSYWAQAFASSPLEKTQEASPWGSAGVFTATNLPQHSSFPN
jgi:hypothetical protein